MTMPGKLKSVNMTMDERDDQSVKLVFQRSLGQTNDHPLASFPSTGRTELPLFVWQQMSHNEYVIKYRHGSYNHGIQTNRSTAASEAF